MQPFKALLVEGTSGVGKSTLIDALIRKHSSSSRPRKIRSFVHLAQSHTYGPLAQLEDAGTLTVRDNQVHLERIIGLLAWLHAHVQEHLAPWCFVIIDTLHLTHCVRPGIVDWQDVQQFDQQLTAMDCKLLLLKASPESIWKRGIIPRVNEQFLLQYARKFGGSLEEIHQYFVREQESLGELYSRSSMPKLLLDNDRPAEETLLEAYEFWTDTPRSVSTDSCHQSD
jgi:thymidylate kinase